VSEITCPSCGAANPAGNRFCGACGSPLGGTPAETAGVEERKVVTVLFADLTASTEMATRLDPEDLRGVLRSFFDAMVSEIDRFGGTVEKFIGDAVVAVFGAPVVHEDDPERAVRCALAMHRRLGELNEHVSLQAGGDLAMRIGVNTGEVVTHSLDEGLVTGESVNVAARFQTLASPGRVVVGDRTYRHTRGSFAYTELGEATVKGIDRPLRVWQADAEISAMSAAPTLETPLVGRRSEMDLLRLLFDRTVSERRPNLVTIVGPPGIGKSRLSQEVARSLGRDGTRLVRGRCLPYGDGLTYWPFAEILKADAEILDSDPADTILAKAQSRLDPRFPGQEGMGVTSVLLSSIGVEVAPDPLAGTSGDAARRAIARAWQRYVESMSAQGPLLALIEDIQWADPSMLELLEAIVAHTSGPVLVLCMARPDLYERRPDWGGGLSNATTISLSPLSVGDGAALISHLLDGEAPRDVVDAILHRSEGNPFYAGELLRMMIEDGTLARRDGRWALVQELPSALPDTVQGVIASRIDLLPATEKRAIQDASVVGRVFWTGAVERLRIDDAGAAVDGLIAKGLVGERETSTIQGERELIFNHILTRDVAYASIPRARRADAHAAIGAWVEEVTRGRDEEFSEILAYHFGNAGDAARTARYSLLAGNRHLRVFASEQAIDWYDRALDAAQNEAAEVRARICLARGAALEQVGRFAEGLGAYEEALSWAQEAADRELQARALAAQAHVLWLLDRYDEGQERLIVALEGAREAGLADVEARLLYTAGTIRFGRGEFAEALPLHREALKVATAGGDLEGQALAHHGLAETYFFAGPFGQGLEDGARANEIFSELGQRLMVAHNAYMVAWLQAFEGDLESARRSVDSSIETSHEIGNGRDEAFALFTRGWFHLSSLRLDEAEADIDGGLGIFRSLGLLRGELSALSFRCDVHAEAWDLDALSRDVSAALEASDALGGAFVRPPCLAIKGWVTLAEGSVPDADRWFDEARTAGELLNVAWTSRTEILAGEWAGEPARLERGATRLGEASLSENSYWGPWVPFAHGLAAFLEGRFEEAQAAALDARALATRVGERRVQWRAAALAAKAMSAHGRNGRSERYREEAKRIVAAGAAAASGRLRDGFLSRPDVAELLA
jgi:class 3 adenylate cyclase/tetratricopeptide (TPR) repeat protein